jgi:extracellular factor (EF) 3-hydroxypalmitic acid methyl ester biosynthesis protein
MDFNRDTLEVTRQSVDAIVSRTWRTPRVKYVHASVHSLLKGAARPAPSEKTATYDFVYCAGLFDYLSDKVCSRLLSLFCQWAKSGGLVLATNVHPSNEYRGVMEHILDWYLIYRDETHMGQLAPAACNTKVYTDETGMNVFLEMRTMASPS